MLVLEKYREEKAYVKRHPYRLIIIIILIIIINGAHTSESANVKVQ
jgi:hypothetical protein